MNNLPTVTKNLLIINVLCFFGTIVARKYGVDLTDILGLHFFMASDFKLFQLVTYMFMHGNFAHLFFNMYTLYVFGTVLERVWGTRKFLLYYFVTGIGAALVHIGVQWLTGDFALTVGASGAIYGILMGYAMLYPDSTLMLLLPPVSVKAKWLVLIFAGIELLLGVTGTQAGVAHFAHLGGLVFGLFLILYWKKTHRLYSRWD